MYKVLILSLCVLVGCSSPIDTSKAFTPQALSKSGMNVVVILDGSGSMSEEMSGGTKIDVAKSSLISVLDTIPKGTNVGILCFSGNTYGWIYSLQLLDLDEAANCINKVEAGGMTPLGQFMEEGANALLELREKSHYGIYRMLIVTDGEATDNAERPMWGEDGILSKGITVQVIGVNMPSHYSLATMVPYRVANDPEGLKNAIATVFAETNAQTADEDFELLTGLDVAVAPDVIKALSSVDNAPVGQHETRE